MPPKEEMMKSTVRNPNLEATPEADTTQKKPFVEPKLTYMTPKLKEHGKVEDVTLQGFFGPFTP
jgi:hypothetical protein